MSTSEQWVWILGVIFIVSLLFIIVSEKICPSCKKHRAGVLLSKKTKSFEWYVEYDCLWQCKKCGHEWHEIHSSTYI